MGAVAAGVAPPVVVPPPVQPASLPVAGVATQTLGTNAELASAWMPSANAAAPLAPHVAGAMLPRTGVSEAELMQVLSDSARLPQASPSVNAWSTAEQQSSGLSEPQAATSPAYAIMKILGAAALSAMTLMAPGAARAAEGAAE